MKRKNLKQKHSRAVSERSLTVMLLGSILLLTTLTGCAKTTKLYPITDKDIFFQDSGNVCFSQYYMEEVLKAKVRE